MQTKHSKLITSHTCIYFHIIHISCNDDDDDDDDDDDGELIVIIQS